MRALPAFASLVFAVIIGAGATWLGLWWPAATVIGAFVFFGATTLLETYVARGAERRAERAYRKGERR